MARQGDEGSIIDVIANEIAARTRAARRPTQRVHDRDIDRNMVEDKRRTELLEGARRGDAASIDALWREYRCRLL